MNLAPCRPRCRRSGSSQASSTWAADPASIDSVAPIGMESRRPTGRSAAETQMRWSPWRRKSWALSLVWSRRAPSTGPGGGEQPVLAGGGGELGQARAEDEAALHVAGDEAVVLQGDGQPVGRRAGQAGGRDELGEGGRAGLEGAEDDGRLVEDADSTSVVHATDIDVSLPETQVHAPASRVRTSQYGAHEARARAGPMA